MSSGALTPTLASRPAINPWLVAAAVVVPWHLVASPRLTWDSGWPPASVAPTAKRRIGA